MKKINLTLVTKNFNIGSARADSLLGRIVDTISGKEKKIAKAGVKDVSFDVESGEIVGIIGRNGSGKSTLLRIIAGIYSADSGSVEISAEKYGENEKDNMMEKNNRVRSKTPNVMYINGFNHGIKPRLTMKENIYAVGAILGLSRKEISAIFNDIVEFSGLVEFVNTKVYQFSTGMILRLNFSIFLFCMSLKKLDVLLLDEVFTAGGDIDFKQKAGEKMNELLRSGVTVLLVSHHLSDLKKYCKRAIWLEKGSVRMDGSIDEILSEYSQILTKNI